MCTSASIAVLINDTALFEVKSALKTLNECTSLSQASFGLHIKILAYERAAKKLKEKVIYERQFKIME